jgi:hypothetical protein
LASADIPFSLGERLSRQRPSSGTPANVIDDWTAHRATLKGVVEPFQQRFFGAC